MTGIIPLIIGIVVLLIFSAFFSGSETAMMALSKSQIKRMESGTAGEKAVWRLLRAPQQLLATLLVGNMFVNNLLTLLVAVLLSRACQAFVANFHMMQSLQVQEVVLIVLNIAIVTPLLMVFGELTPKTVAYRHSVELSRLASRPLQAIGAVMSPIVWVFKVMTTVCQTLLGMKPHDNWDMLTRDEVAETVTAAVNNGQTSRPAAEILERILRFDDITASEIMIPRTHLDAINDHTPVAQAFEEIRRSSYRYLPVYHDDLDDIWGVISFTDYPLWVDVEDGHRPLSEFREQLESHRDGIEKLPVKPVSFVLQNVKIATIVADRALKTSISIIVVDEYGETMGLITMNSIFEEIIGRLSTQRNDPDRLTPIKQGGWYCGGKAHLRAISESLHDDFGETDADTVGGYIMEQLEHLPTRGETIETAFYRYKVLRMNGNSVERVVIKPLVANTQPVPEKAVTAEGEHA